MLTGSIRTGLAAVLVTWGAATLAQTGPFDGGWTLQPDSSTLNFQSTKNETKVETSRFAVFSGEITETGGARVTVQLESVDTGIDLRNVRMRFLFFESFQYPEATVTAQLDPSQLADLAQVRRKVVAVPYVLNLHGVVKTAVTNVAVTLLTDDLVNVSTPTPISVAAADYDLMGGVTKLEEAAGVDILPQGAVTFDFTFARNTATTAPQESAPEATEDPAEVVVATQENVTMEPEGNFTPEACKGRFEIMSRTDNITFASGSARVNESSNAILDSLTEIISRCPGMVIEVGGHTDSVGSDANNQRLSERRAASVVEHLRTQGIAAEALVSVGYGEAKPAHDNATSEGRRRNRRIEFLVIKG